MPRTTNKEKKYKTKQNLTKRSTPVWVWIVIGVSAIAVIFWLTFNSTTADASNKKLEISLEETVKLQKEGALIVDVREQSEWDQFHIPGAKLIPLGDLPSQLNTLPKDKQIVVVCRTSRRSAEGRNILLNAGFKNVSNMAGGMTEWKENGYPIETGD